MCDMRAQKRVFVSLPNTFEEGKYNSKLEYVGSELVTFKKWLFHRSKLDIKQCNFGGVYIMLSAEGDVLYVGKANNFSDRLRKHLAYISDCNLFMDYVHSVILVKDAQIKEDYYIKLLRPIFNTAGSTDSTYSVARKTIISKYPAHKDNVIRQLILRDRAQNGSQYGEITMYSEETDVDMIMDMMAIIAGHNKPAVV